MRQPLRASVDPQALSAAYTLRAAAVMAKSDHLIKARALYERMLARYGQRDWGYYVEQAQEALASLQDSAPALIALRTRATVSR